MSKVGKGLGISGLVCVYVLVAAPLLAAQSPPVRQAVLTFGGGESQLGYGIAVRDGQVVVCGEGSPGAPLYGFSLEPALPPLWSSFAPYEYFAGVGIGRSGIFTVGSAWPTTCGASDNAGGTEWKSLFASFTLSGIQVGCSSPNWFPYRGGEGYYGMIMSQEAGADVIYAVGMAEQSGWSYSLPLVLAKYDVNGNLLAQVSEPGITVGTWQSFSRPTESGGFGLAELNGSIYIAGFSDLTGFGEDAVRRPVLLKYDAALNRLWKVRATSDSESSYPGYEGRFNAVAAADGDIFAVGQAQSAGAGGIDFLIERYDEAGNRVWSASWGGPFEDALKGVVAVGPRLFAVGYSYQCPTSNETFDDVACIVFEIDPADGSVIWSDVFDGTRLDKANGAATDGNDLYVVGVTRSFATPEGNVPGVPDILLLHYRLNRSPVADAGTYLPVSVGTSGSGEVTLDGSGSSDPDGDPLTYTWTGPFGTVTGAAPTVVLPLGTSTITLTIADGRGGTDFQTFEIEVVDDTPPVIGSLAAGPNSLWPANHKMTAVAVTVSAEDNCGPFTARIVSVTSNEPVDGLGDGDTSPDWEITGDLTVDLRAERSGAGTGRIYTIRVQCTDEAGNSSFGDVTVVVPRDKGK